MVEQDHSASRDAVAPQAVGATAGDILQQQRERAGLSREAVADRLNLTQSQVAALEKNDFSPFPGETFVKGHLRTYARLLKLDCDAVLRAYKGAQPRQSSAPVAPEARPFTWKPVSLEAKPSAWKRYSGLGLAFMLLLGLWGWQQQRDRSQLMSLTAATTDTLGGIDSALNNAADDALMNSVQLMPSLASAPSAPAAQGAGQTSTSPATSAPTEQRVEGDSLSLRFTADCWIEIKDRDNRLLVATLKHANEQLQIEGRGPFKVLLGYAPGVVMAYNGAPVKVDVVEGSRATRLIVGSS